MSFEILEKLEPILKSDWRGKFSENQNLFDLIENENLSKFDSKQMKELLYKSDIPRVFAEAILDKHYSKRKLFYKRTKREQDTFEGQQADRNDRCFNRTKELLRIREDCLGKRDPILQVLPAPPITAFLSALSVSLIFHAPAFT